MQKHSISCAEFVLAYIGKSKPESAILGQSQPESVRVCQNLLEGVSLSKPQSSRVSQTQQESAKLSQSQQESARVSHCHQKSSRVGQSHPESARICQSKPEFYMGGIFSFFHLFDFLGPLRAPQEFVWEKLVLNITLATNRHMNIFLFLGSQFRRGHKSDSNQNLL